MEERKPIEVNIGGCGLSPSYSVYVKWSNGEETQHDFFTEKKAGEFIKEIELLF